VFSLLLQKKVNNKEEAVRLRAGLKWHTIDSICKQRTELATYIKGKVFPEHLTLALINDCKRSNRYLYNSSRNIEILADAVPTTHPYFYSKTNQMHQCIKFILFWNDAVHVSDGLSIHHQEFKTVHTATGICQTDIALCLLT
jgi:hypothetical protein